MNADELGGSDAMLSSEEREEDDVETDDDDNIEPTDYIDPTDNVEPDPTYNVEAPATFFKAPNGCKWYKEPQVGSASRVPAANIFKQSGTVGPISNFRNAPLLLVFNRLFNIHLKNEIVKWTNNKAESEYNRLNAVSSRQRQWMPLTLSELRCLPWYTFIHWCFTRRPPTSANHLGYIHGSSYSS